MRRLLKPEMVEMKTVADLLRINTANTAHHLQEVEFGQQPMS